MEITEKMSLVDIQERINKNNPTCLCGASLGGRKIKRYDHDGGIQVIEYYKKQWMYVHCNRCGYDMAIWKILGEI